MKNKLHFKYVDLNFEWKLDIYTTHYPSQKISFYPLTFVEDLH